MILIYCPEENPRVVWTLDLVFRQLLGLDYKLTGTIAGFTHTDGPQLVYSFKPIENIPFIEASGLLFEQEILDQSDKLQPGENWAGLPTLFSYRDSPSSLPFDIFSAIFYLVSRYEEYLPFTPDKHGRFQSKESLAVRLGFIDKPVVNQWIIEFGKQLESWFGSSISIRQPAYQFQPTIDIDNAWAMANKGLWRTIGGAWRDRRNMELRNFRYQVLRGNQPDPYYTYPLLHKFHTDAQVNPIWFFLLGNYGQFDKNISPNNKQLQKLIREIANEYPIGIHPSYASNSIRSMVSSERETLAKITGQPINSSRQHYLRLRLPDTYRTLIKTGITADYTMGYPDCPGFRASIASPFIFFDLELNNSTPLTVYPFQVMDTCLRQYQKLTPEKSIEKIAMLVDEVKKVNGTFISLWHNESLSEWREWTGWSKVYLELLTIAKTK